MEYVRIIKELEEIREERLFVAEVFRDFELQNAIEEHEREKAMTLDELEVSGWLWKGGIPMKTAGSSAVCVFGGGGGGGGGGLLHICLYRWLRNVKMNLVVLKEKKKHDNTSKTLAVVV